MIPVSTPDNSKARLGNPRFIIIYTPAFLLINTPCSVHVARIQQQAQVHHIRVNRGGSVTMWIDLLPPLLLIRFGQLKM